MKDIELGPLGLSLVLQRKLNYDTLFKLCFLMYSMFIMIISMFSVWQMITVLNTAVLHYSFVFLC